MINFLPTPTPLSLANLPYGQVGIQLQVDHIGKNGIQRKVRRSQQCVHKGKMMKNLTSYFNN